MFNSLNLPSLSLALSLLLLTSNPAHSFQIHGSSIALTRLDPIVNPGALSSHVHMIMGGSNFGPSLTSAHLEASTCSSLETQQDKSAYWVSPPYGQNANGSWNALPVTSVSIYYKKVNNQPIVPFPPNFRMLIGNPAATSKNFVDPFMSFQCQNFIPAGDPTGQWNFSSGWERLPTMDCSRIKLATTFPNCWDGINADSPNHRDHVHNDIGGGTDCPPSHPKRIAQITLEIDFWADDYKWEDISLSSGSKSGWGIHADYFFGWANNGEMLNKALADPTCIEAQGIQAFYPSDQRCETLVPYANETTANLCSASLISPIAQEEVGLTRSIPELPGCNPRFDAPGYPASKPACDRVIPVAAIGPPSRVFPWSDRDPRHTDYPRNLAIWDVGVPPPIVTPVPVTPVHAPTIGFYTFQGCYTELNNARALSQARFDNSLMSPQRCAASCAAYKYFGVEYGTECYCGDVLGSGSTLANLGDCSFICPGDKGSFCGSGGRMELYLRDGSVSSSSSSSTVASSSVKTTVPTTMSTVKTTLSTTKSSTTTTTKSSTTTTSAKTTTTTTTTTMTTTTTKSPTPTGPSSGTMYMTQGQNWDGFAQDWTWTRGTCKVLTSSFAKNLGSAGPNVGFCTFYDDTSCKGNVLLEMSFPGKSQLGNVGTKVLAFSCK